MNVCRRSVHSETYDVNKARNKTYYAVKFFRNYAGPEQYSEPWQDTGR
jgi:hypothetical protein